MRCVSPFGAATLAGLLATLSAGCADRMPARGADAVADGGSGSRDGCARYEPAALEVRGRISIIDRYGPPNFGETPAQDERLRVPVLALRDTLRLCADPARPADTEALAVTQVQLNLARHGALGDDLRTRDVLVRGQAMLGFTGYHVLPVVLQVDEITPVR